MFIYELLFLNMKFDIFNFIINIPSIEILLANIFMIMVVLSDTFIMGGLH